MKFNAPESFADRFTGVGADDRLQPDQFRCNSYEWLGPIAGEIQQTGLFHSIVWTSERMLTNPETGINENRTSQVAENVIFKWKKDHFELLSVGHLAVEGNSLGGVIIPVGAISTLQVNSKSQICQASFSYNLQTAVAGIDLNSHFNEKPNFQPYKSAQSMAFRFFVDRFKDYLLPKPGGPVPRFD